MRARERETFLCSEKPALKIPNARGNATAATSLTTAPFMWAGVSSIDNKYNQMKPPRAPDPSTSYYFHRNSKQKTNYMCGHKTSSVVHEAAVP